MDCNPFKSSVGLRRTGAPIGPVLLCGRACLSNHNTLFWDMISVKTPINEVISRCYSCYYYDSH